MKSKFKINEIVFIVTDEIEIKCEIIAVKQTERSFYYDVDLNPESENHIIAFDIQEENIYKPKAKYP